MTAKTFTDRSNCIRAAKKALPGAVPSVDFHVKQDEKGRFFWVQGPAPKAAPDSTMKATRKGAKSGPKVRTGKPSDKELLATMDPPEKEHTVHADDSVIEAMLKRGEELAKHRENRTRGGKGQRKAVWQKAYDDASAGKMPSKPVIKSDNASNQSYQRHIDSIHELALKVKRGNAPITELQAYKVPGTNTYAKMARRHQELMLLALVVKDGAPAAKQQKAA